LSAAVVGSEHFTGFPHETPPILLSYTAPTLTAPATQAGEEIPSGNASLPDATTGTTPAARAFANAVA